MSPLGRFVLLGSATSMGLVVALLLYALDRKEIAIALGAVSVIGVVAGSLAAAGSIPMDRLRSPDENARFAYMTFVHSALTLALAPVQIAVLGYAAAGAAFALIGLATAVIGVSFLNTARMLRRVPELTGPLEKPRALALGGNAMPGRARSLVVATDSRIVWADGPGLRDRHTLRLRDLERFDIDRKTATLTAAGAGEELRVAPVARAELEKFEHIAVQMRAAGA